MKKLCQILIALIFSLQLAAQMPNWYLPASRKVHYPIEEWYIGFAAGSMQRGETYNDAIRRLNLKEEAQSDLVSTISVDIQRSTDTEILSELIHSSNNFEEYIREFFHSGTRIISNINGIHDLKIETYCNNREVAVFAYVNKQELKKYYLNSLSVTYENIRSNIYTIDYLISEEKFLQAQEILNAAKIELTKSDDNFRWVLLLVRDNDDINLLLKQRIDLHKKLDYYLPLLSNKTSIYMYCTGDFFDLSCSVLSDAIKDELSNKSCVFVHSPSEADWIIELNTQAILNQSSSQNSDWYHVELIVTTTIHNVPKNQTSTIYSSDTDASLKSNGSYQLAAKKIIDRNVFAEQISKEIFEKLTTL